MKTINCEECKKDFDIAFPSMCKECTFKNINKLKNKFANYEEYKWHKRKKFAYNIILYLPVIAFLGMKYGVKYELLWLFGGIHLILSACLSSILSEIF